MESRGRQWGHSSEPRHPQSSFPREGTWGYAYDQDPQGQQQLPPVSHQIQLPTGGLSGFNDSQYDMGEEISRVPRPRPQYLNAPYQADMTCDSRTYIGPQAAASPYIMEEPIYPQATGVAPPGHGQRESDRFDNIYRKYQRLLRETNSNTHLGRAVEAADSLIEMSRLVVNNVESLGILTTRRCFSAYNLLRLELTKDDKNLYKDQLDFWKQFNNCWLAFLIRQLQNSQARRKRGQPLSGGLTVLSKHNIEALGDELIRLDDGLQNTGLINYQMGVWEDEIIDGKQIIVIRMFNISLTHRSIDSMLEYLSTPAHPQN